MKLHGKGESGSLIPEGTFLPYHCMGDWTNAYIALMPTVVFFKKWTNAYTFSDFFAKWTNAYTFSA